ncbi:MAG: hypothetical protein M3Y27_28165 [Acidobacteriota bacterium]|nr:hypothetical protein [Acidobacteriota bacterium]
MTLSDLFFLISVVFVLLLCSRIAIFTLRRRFDVARRSAWLLGLFLASYAVVLISVAVMLPRRFYTSGERRCFDDWCLTALNARVAKSLQPGCRPDRGSRTWLAVVQVSSTARRVRQRARDARAELEDHNGNRYLSCAAPVGSGAKTQRSLSDEIGPGEL